jgi:hypothetical protein
MWAIARVDLGLSTEEFSKLTPRKYSALVDRLQARDQKNYMGHGIVASTVANYAPFANPDRKALSPLDFVPGYKKPKQKKIDMSIEEQVALLTGAFGCGPVIPKNKKKGG